MAWNKYLSVEVPLFLTTFCLILEGAVLTNLYIYRTCYVLLGYNESDCNQLGNKHNNITEWLEPKVQPTVNNIVMVQNVIGHGIPIIFCLCVGTWSDKFGRKPFIIYCIAGTLVSNAMNTLIIHFTQMSPWWFILSGLPFLFTGGMTTLMLTISTYLMDVSTEKDRVIRLGIFEMIFALSSVLGNLASSYLFYATSYQTVYFIATACIAISLLYTILLIPESLPSEKTPFSIPELIRTINVKDIAKETFKKRENNSRRYILIFMMISIIHGMGYGDMTVYTLFLRAKLNFTLSKITLLSSITSFGNICGTLFSTYVLYRMLKIKPLNLCIFGLICICTGNSLRGLATNEYYVYAANSVLIFMGIPSLMIRTTVSFLVAPSEMGKIFAMLSILFSLDGIASSLIYPIVYNATLNTNPGLYNFMTFGINFTVCILVVIISRMTLPLYKPPHDEEQNQEEINTKKISVTINHFESLGFDDKRSGNTRLSLTLTDARRISESPVFY